MKAATSTTRPAKARRHPIALCLALVCTVSIVASVVRGQVSPAIVFAILGLTIAWLVRLRNPRIRGDLRQRREAGVAAAMQAAAFLSATPSLRIGKLDLSDLAFVAAVLLLLVTAEALSNKEPPRVTPLMVGAGLVVVGGLLGSFFPPNWTVYRRAAGGYRGSGLAFLPPEFADLLRFAGVSVGMLLLVKFWRPDGKRRRELASAYGAGVMASVVYGLAVGATSGDRAQGLTTHPVYYGVISALGVMVGIGLATGVRGRSRVYGVLVAISGLLGVLGSGTRSGALVIVGSLIFYLVAMRSVRVVGALFASLLIGLLLTVAAGGLVRDAPTVTRLRGGGFAANSDAIRRDLREDTLELVRRRGFTGAGFQYLIPAHSLVLGTIAAAGILGLAGLLAVGGALLKSLAGTRDPPDPLRAAVIAGVLGYFAIGWVANGGWDRWLWILIAVFGTVARARTVEGGLAR